MSQRQASKAAARCAEATAISTLVSPISRRPRRWTMATSRIWNFCKASAASASSCWMRHLFIGFIVKIESLASARLVAHHALKDERCAVFPVLQPVDRGLRVDLVPNDASAAPAPPVCRLGASSSITVNRASTHRRQQCHFVACLESCIRPGVFPIHRQCDRGKRVFQSRNCRFVPCNHIADRSTLRHIDLVGGSSRQISQHPEE